MGPPRLREPLVYKWLNSMVYGTYNYSIHGDYFMVYKPTYNWGPHPERKPSNFRKIVFVWPIANIALVLETCMQVTATRQLTGPLSRFVWRKGPFNFPEGKLLRSIHHKSTIRYQTLVTMMSWSMVTIKHETLINGYENHVIPSGTRLHNYGKIHHAINGKIHYFNGHF